MCSGFVFVSAEEDCVVNDGGGVLIFPVMGPGHVTTVTTVTRAVVTAGDTQLTYYHTHLLQNENTHKPPQKYCFTFGKRTVVYRTRRPGNQKLRIMAPKAM